MPPPSAEPRPSLFQNRWLILFFSVLSMVAVANFQYGWTLFVPPLQKHLHAEQAAIQVTFTVFVLLETWLVPFEGWLVDKFGPRLLVMAGGVFAGLGVFAVAIAFDLAAAAMALLVLRNMKLPAHAELPAGIPAPPHQPSLLPARKA
jgi:OFA family oxalate/formate antiporter-like MFS transporter